MLDSFDDSQRMPGVDGAVHEDNIGHFDVQFAVKIISPVDSGVEELFAELGPEDVRALLHEEVDGELVAEDLRLVRGGLVEAELRAGLVGPLSAALGHGAVPADVPQGLHHVVVLVVQAFLVVSGQEEAVHRCQAVDRFSNFFVHHQVAEGVDGDVVSAGGFADAIVLVVLHDAREIAGQAFVEVGHVVGIGERVFYRIAEFELVAYGPLARFIVRGEKLVYLLSSFLYGVHALRAVGFQGIFHHPVVFCSTNNSY